MNDKMEAPVYTTPPWLNVPPSNEMDQIMLTEKSTAPRNFDLQNVAIPVEPVHVPPRDDYEQPPIMAAAKYGALFPHVAPRGKDLLHILVHGAAFLPMIDGRPPRSYVTAQTIQTMATQDIGETINATNATDGISPHWNEMIFAEVFEDSNHSEEIIILIIDEPRQRTLAEHRFPWRWLEPFYQYHLNLQYTIKQTAQTTNLYISIMRKQSSLSKEDIRYFGLEVLINRFDVPIPKKQSLFTVGRIVPNYDSYRHDFLRNLNNPKVGVDFRKITFPTSGDFTVPEFSLIGYPQASLASKESKLPTWMHDYLFSHEQEKDNMFSNDSAFVLEFYPFRNIANNPDWSIKDMLGWVAIRLDQRTFDALTATNSLEGMRTEGLLVESEGDLMAESSKYLTAEVLIRLVSERHPVKNLLAYSASNLPTLPSYYVDGIRQGGAQPVYMQVTVPAARKQVLPAIQSQPVPPVMHSPVPLPQQQPTYLPGPQFYTQPQFEMVPSMQQVDRHENVRFVMPNINPYELDDIPTEYRAMLPHMAPPRRADDMEGWMDYFQREISNYKQAIRRIIKDVIQAREQYKSLTLANQDLRIKLENFDKKKKLLVEIFEGDKIDKAKMNDLFNRLSAKVSAQSLELKESYTKILTYEKELARRNELRSQYEALIKTSQAREIEIQMMKERLSKADGLEETVRRQELVIEKLEGMITNYMKEKRLRGAFGDDDRTFLSQHAALGLETQQLQRRVPATNFATMPNTHQQDLARQNLAYQQELANLKARFQENASAWGREKVELLDRINDLDQPTTTPRTRKLKPLS